MPWAVSLLAFQAVTVYGCRYLRKLKWHYLLTSFERKDAETQSFYMTQYVNRYDYSISASLRLCVLINRCYL